MDKTQLKQLVTDKFSTRAIATHFNCSQTNVRWWLRHYGLKTCCEPCNRNSRTYKPKPWSCIKCGETDPARFYKAKNRCKTCHNQKTIERGRHNKRLAVEYKGGKCARCGYSKNLAALDFHHPGEKDPNWIRMRTRNFENIRGELDKCVLLCRNCHAEAHYPMSEYSELN